MEVPTNYRRKYEDAIKRAEKEILACGSLDCDAARLIYRIFPETKTTAMTRIEEIEKASKEYRESREECGVKDPILLDEVDEAHFMGAIWADTHPIRRDINLDKESIGYLLNEHKSPLNYIMHQVDLKTGMQYQKDIQDAFKAGFRRAVEG